MITILKVFVILLHKTILSVYGLEIDTHVCMQSIIFYHISIISGLGTTILLRTPHFLRISRKVFFLYIVSKINCDKYISRKLTADHQPIEDRWIRLKPTNVLGINFKGSDDFLDINFKGMGRWKVIEIQLMSSLFKAKRF